MLVRHRLLAISVVGRLGHVLGVLDATALGIDIAAEMESPARRRAIPTDRRSYHGRWPAPISGALPSTALAVADAHRS
jgi:hypothetical protein